jgi:peptidyl-tRNA hydrolase (EC 3.1.1.29)
VQGLGFKQSIVLRKDLKMGHGKAAAQASHASCDAVFQILESNRKDWKEWLDLWKKGGQMKVVLRVNSREEIEEIYEQAIELGLPCSIISDAGRTQLPPGTITAVCIGPAPEETVDKITGKLKLY